LGLFSAIHRRTWKSAVVTEFHKLHGINLRAIGDQIGPGTLDDLLNVQYEYAGNNPKLGAENVTRVLDESFGVNVAALAMRARIFGNDAQ
jgi:hypothetical protein